MELYDYEYVFEDDSKKEQDDNHDPRADIVFSKNKRRYYKGGIISFSKYKKIEALNEIRRKKKRVFKERSKYRVNFHRS